MRFQVSEKDRKALCRQAPEFREIAGKTEIDGFECPGDPFHALVQSILSQQLSVKAADTIHRRVERLLGTVSPDTLDAAAPDALRACGVSVRKIGYLRGIAHAALSGAVDFSALPRLSDAEVVRELVKLRGVGVWTAEMLLIFALGRPDVLSYRDLGIRRGIMLLNRLEHLSEKEFEFYRKRYSPYGTLASLYLWRIKDGGLSLPSRPAV